MCFYLILFLLLSSCLGNEEMWIYNRTKCVCVCVGDERRMK